MSDLYARAIEAHTTFLKGLIADRVREATGCTIVTAVESVEEAYASMVTEECTTTNTLLLIDRAKDIATRKQAQS